MIDHLGAQLTTNYGYIISDSGLIVEKSLFIGLLYISIFYIITVDVSLALDVLLRGGEARPGKIIGLALHSSFRIEKVLCCGIPYLHFILVNFPILRWLLFEVM